MIVVRDDPGDSGYWMVEGRIREGEQAVFVERAGLRSGQVRRDRTPTHTSSRMYEYPDMSTSLRRFSSIRRRYRL